jgi:hypothetical protein
MKPVKSFQDAKAAAGRIWERIQNLGDTAEPTAKSGAQAAQGASSKAQATKKATARQQRAPSDSDGLAHVIGYESSSGGEIETNALYNHRS